MTFILVLFAQVYAVQNDWSGGPGVQGPVLSWGNTFYQSNNINYTNPGILSLLATVWSFSSWSKHVIDSSPGPENHYQGFSTFDIDGDGDKDLVLLSGNYVRWYEFTGNWSYVQHNIAWYPWLSWEYYAAIWADDFDNDGDGDIVVADAGDGLYYLRNDGATWTSTTLSTDSRSQVFSGDFDGDGDMDIVASNRSMWGTPGIWWYENDGTGSFTEHSVWLPGYDVWRPAVGDLNGDLIPDIVAVGCCGNGYVHVFINDGTGHFTHYQPNHYFDCIDGMWLNDIDVDGDLDITVAKYYNAPEEFEALLNNGTGTGWSWVQLTGDASNYTDGSIARDMDLDGLPDIAGAYYDIGYFRQSLPWPTFTEYYIDYFYNAHWVFPDDVDQISCTPDIDILATREGEHAIYENRMAAEFAPLGDLESSILQLNPASDSGGEVSYFGWGGNSCIPNDTAVALYWRGGNTVAEVLAAGWTGPFYFPQGSDPDSIYIGTPCIKYFQYKLELRPDTTNNEVATQGGIWIKYTNCPVYVDKEEREPTVPSRFKMFQKPSGQLVLELPADADVNLKMYDATGRLVSILARGHLEAGVHTFEPNAPGGVYLAVFTSNRWMGTLKMLIR